MSKRNAWRTTGLRAVTAAGLALATAITAAGAAHSASAPITGPDSGDWGTVVETPDGIQSNAWVARVQGIGKVVDARLFESAYPATPTAPADQAGGNGLINLTVGGVGLGKASALFSRSLGNALPATISGKETVPAPGVAYADAGGASVDVGIPYVDSPTGGTQLSAIGVHVDAIRIHAMSRPGKALELDGGAARGYISVLGNRIIDIPSLWPVNFGARIPADYSQSPFALASTNEQVTTDNKGVPTLGKDGHYQYDPKATSGYVTAIHASVLGPEVADVTVGHAAVIRDPAKTDMLAPKVPKLPTWLDSIFEPRP
ncbi:hypothetical protein [Streptomyces sp. NBC_01465]|uniref:hypothetical protein n=1 Tax=Streptomyces sp. NBC_01465 TaxID=2903878 RepID=UPI002E335E26|nr:hypothetical protein [Streptomyces sp. NBC_01465]